MRRLTPFALITAALLAPGLASPAWADPSEPSERADDAFDFMNLLSRHHLHDLENERWNVYGQLTWISSFKLPFYAKYTDLNGSSNSLKPGFEHSFTGTITAFIGTKLWNTMEVYWVPEVIMERPLSHLTGLGGAIQNFELQKTGSEIPTVYSSRLYFRQTVNLGGHKIYEASNPQQVATHYDSRRIVLSFGNFSILDFFDKNSYAGELRRQFFNMSFLTYAAYDFAADARGYTWGGVVEVYLDDWALRMAQTVVPQDPNQLPLDFKFWQYYGQQAELEHDHKIRGRPGAIRVLAYRNHEDMAKFSDAIQAFEQNPAHNAAACTGFHYASQNASAPDLCWARRPNVKWGIGVNLEQAIWRDIGVFFRGMYSDGQTEVYSYTSTDRSVSAGVLARGSLWHRARDYAGIGYAAGFISSEHAKYLAMGGVDGFVGDGAIRQAAEQVFEVFYGVNVWSSIWLSGDYQLIANPGFNADRGPVSILGARLHAEF